MKPDFMCRFDQRESSSCPDALVVLTIEPANVPLRNVKDQMKLPPKHHVVYLSIKRSLKPTSLVVRQQRSENRNFQNGREASLNRRGLPGKKKTTSLKPQETGGPLCRRAVLSRTPCLKTSQEGRTQGEENTQHKTHHTSRFTPIPRNKFRNSSPTCGNVSLLQIKCQRAADT